jgi:hypothetical protein
MSAITIIGNHGPAYRNGVTPSGVAVPNVADVGMGWTAVIANDAGQSLIALNSLVRGDINVGVHFQGTAGVKVSFTLANTASALSSNPDVQDSVTWSNEITMGADIVPAEVLFTALKVVFDGPGELYIAVR